MKTDLTKLTDIMAALRDSDNGCPWDLQQSHHTLVSMTFEEVAELADAIAQDDTDNICEELGDVLFHLVFYARIAQEQGDFSMQDVIDVVAEKMIRRHPHIFAGKVYANEAEQKADWESIKAQEKKLKPKAGTGGALLTKPSGVSAIAHSIAIQKQLANMGFDWTDAESVFEKIEEEAREVKAEMAVDDREKIAEEYGDLLFAVLNLGRKLDLDPDMTLRRANHKFLLRCEAMIDVAGNQENFAHLSLAEKEILWNEVKKTS